MNIELHLIQNFAPSNLNRSDTGSPKDCEFGGVRRARISSQCFKRAIREYFAKGDVFTGEQKQMLAKRTRLLLNTLTEKLVEQGKDREQAQRVATIALTAGDLDVKEDGKTEFLVFLGTKEIQDIANLCANYWDKLVEIAAHYEQACNKEDARNTNKKDTRKNAHEELKKYIPNEIKKAVKALLDGGQAADLALFGRMLATLPEKNLSAASQVAHAISTHKVGIEFDFYTAVDDLLSTDETGAGMMGTVEFNSACFYRYANIDVRQLKENLKGDESLVEATIQAFIEAMIHAIPTGKQNSMAAQNPPSFVLVVVRQQGFWSLSNAFVNPVKGTDIVKESINKLDEYWGQLVKTYGDDGIYKAYINLSGEDLPNLGKPALNKAELILKTLEVLGSEEKNSNKC